MKRIIAALVAVLALAGCGASTPSHHASKPKTSATNSPIVQKSIKDGESYGQTAGATGSSASLVRANCDVLRVENMPSGDIASAWMTGCELTGILGG